jgi:hypothetical protein
MLHVAVTNRTGSVPFPGMSRTFPHNDKGWTAAEGYAASLVRENELSPCAVVQIEDDMGERAYFNPGNSTYQKGPRIVSGPPASPVRWQDTEPAPAQPAPAPARKAALHELQETQAEGKWRGGVAAFEEAHGKRLLRLAAERFQEAYGYGYYAG